MQPHHFKLGQTVYISPAAHPYGTWEKGTISQQEQEQYSVQLTDGSLMTQLSPTHLYAQSEAPAIAAQLKDTALHSCIAWCRNGYMDNGLEGYVNDYIHFYLQEICHTHCTTALLRQQLEQLHADCAPHLHPLQQSRLRCQLLSIAFSHHQPRFKQLHL